jgi:hypothetical protein
VSELRELKAEVRGDIQRRLGALETFAAEHAKTCPALGLEHDMENLTGWMKKIDTTLSVFTHEGREQRAQIAGQAKWLENLDKSHGEHVRDREAHRHG